MLAAVLGIVVGNRREFVEYAGKGERGLCDTAATIELGVNSNVLPIAFSFLNLSQRETIISALCSGLGSLTY